LLQALDGIVSKEGCLVFMTTNRKEAIDERLYRPGRIDAEFHFGPATAEQIERMYRHFFPEAPVAAAREFARDMASSNMTMNVVQKYLVDNSDALEGGSLSSRPPQITNAVEITSAS
jgi:chaperone BCS1